MVFDLFSMLNRIVVVVIPYPGQKVYKYIYSAIPKRPLIWHYTVSTINMPGIPNILPYRYRSRA